MPATQALTRAQREVMVCLVNGMTCKQMALHYGVSGSAIRSRLSAAYVRLGVTNARQAIAKLAREDWTPIQPPAVDTPDDPELPPFARAYLAAFDAGDVRGRRLALRGLVHSAGLDPSVAERPKPDPLDRLLADMARL